MQKRANASNNSGDDNSIQGSNLNAKQPMPFKMKPGAVVWIEVDYSPDEQESAPKLSADDVKLEKASYEVAIATFLNKKQMRCKK